MSDVSPIPPGHPRVVPHLIVNNATEAIEFYQKAFNATEVHRMHSPDGKIMHAEINIGGSPIFLVDEMPGMGNSSSPATLQGTTVTLHLWFDDVDAAFEQAVNAGANGVMPPMDCFWGDRFGKVIDPFGHGWSMATHIKDLSEEEIEKGATEFFASGE